MLQMMPTIGRKTTNNSGPCASICTSIRLASDRKFGRASQPGWPSKIYGQKYEKGRLVRNRTLINNDYVCCRQNREILWKNYSDFFEVFYVEFVLQPVKHERGRGSSQISLFNDHTCLLIGFGRLNLLHNSTFVWFRLPLGKQLYINVGFVGDYRTLFTVHHPFTVIAVATGHRFLAGEYTVPIRPSHFTISHALLQPS